MGMIKFSFWATEFVLDTKPSSTVVFQSFPSQLNAFESVALSRAAATGDAKFMQAQIQKIEVQISYSLNSALKTKFCQKNRFTLFFNFFRQFWRENEINRQFFLNFQS